VSHTREASVKITGPGSGLAPIQITGPGSGLAPIQITGPGLSSSQRTAIRSYAADFRQAFVLFLHFFRALETRFRRARHVEVDDLVVRIFELLVDVRFEFPTRAIFFRIVLSIERVDTLLRIDFPEQRARGILGALRCIELRIVALVERGVTLRDLEALRAMRVLQFPGTFAKFGFVLELELLGWRRCNITTTQTCLAKPNGPSGHP